MPSSGRALGVAGEPHFAEAGKVVSDGGPADLALGAFIRRDDSLVDFQVRLGGETQLSVVALGHILAEDVRRVRVVREELLHNEWRLHDALVDRRFDRRASLHGHWLLLARREEERVLVALPLRCVKGFALGVLVDVDRDLLPQELLLAAELRFLVPHRVASVVDVPVALLAEVTLVPDVVELELRGDGLADQVPQLVRVVHDTTLALLHTAVWVAAVLVDDDRHYKRLLLCLRLSLVQLGDMRDVSG